MSLSISNLPRDRVVIRAHFPLVADKPPCNSLASALRLGGLAGASTGGGPECHKYDRLNDQAMDSFEAVGLDDAEVLVYPYHAGSAPRIDQIARLARTRGLGCVFFSWGDADEPVNVPHGTVYRHSLFADRRLAHERAMPAEVSDPEEELGLRIRPREKQQMPTVGFCGFVSNPVARSLYRLMGRRRKAEGLTLRARVLKALKRSRGLQTNFVVRQAYWAGTRGRIHRNSPRNTSHAQFFGTTSSTAITPSAFEAREIFRTDSTKCWQPDESPCSSTPAAFYRSTMKSIGGGTASGSKKTRSTPPARRDSLGLPLPANAAAVPPAAEGQSRALGNQAESPGILPQCAAAGSGKDRRPDPHTTLADCRARKRFCRGDLNGTASTAKFREGRRRVASPMNWNLSCVHRTRLLREPRRLKSAGCFRTYESFRITI